MLNDQTLIWIIAYDFTTFDDSDYSDNDDDDDDDDDENDDDDDDDENDDDCGNGSFSNKNLMINTVPGLSLSNLLNVLKVEVHQFTWTWGDLTGIASTKWLGYRPASM